MDTYRGAFHLGIILAKVLAFANLSLSPRHYVDTTIYSLEMVLRRRENSFFIATVSKQMLSFPLHDDQRNEARFIVDIHFPLTWDAIDR